MRNSFVLLCQTMIAVALFAGVSSLQAAETPVDFNSVRGAAVFTPLPDLYLAWLSNSSCTIHMVVDPTTGRVTNAYVAESSGDTYAHYRLLEALRRWKFRPGTPGLIRITFGFTRNWAQAWSAPERKAKPLDDVLAPFLGKGTLLRGDLPEYPSTPAWTNKRGTGVFELHVDNKGRVSDVTIKTSSGDQPFDRVTVSALRRWRFRRGPLIIELPLSFILTDTSFSVRIPKDH